MSECNVYANYKQTQDHNFMPSLNSLLTGICGRSLQKLQYVKSDAKILMRLQKLERHLHPPHTSLAPSSTPY